MAKIVELPKSFNSNIYSYDNPTFHIDLPRHLNDINNIIVDYPINTYYAVKDVNGVEVKTIHEEPDLNSINIRFSDALREYIVNLPVSVQEGLTDYINEILLPKYKMRISSRQTLEEIKIDIYKIFN